MEVDSRKLDVSEISDTKTIHTLVTQMSTVTQAIEGLQSDMAKTEKKISKREAKAVELQITNSTRRKGGKRTSNKKGKTRGNPTGR